jgi:hypothetical protein
MAFGAPTSGTQAHFGGHHTYNSPAYPSGGGSSGIGGGGPARYATPDVMQDRGVNSSTRQSSLDTATNYGESSGMFWYTIPEGVKVLLVDRTGRGSLIEGPSRIWRWRKKLHILEHHVAYPGEFLIVRYRDGQQEHLPGPQDMWRDPRIHKDIEKEDSLQIAAKEAVVAYSRSEDVQGEIKRRIIKGPAMFVPSPGEWLHTFSWHGSRGDSYKKYPGALVFQKLWLMPDQMYHDVEDVRTADDVVLTIKLMIFFELIDLERMLDETHDPIGDFINAASSDVLDLVSHYSFDQFKSRTEMLNDLEKYPQLKGRAQQVGYKLHKIVYRGYSTTSELEAMHNQAIEMRTRLKLERETETQAQELADFKQQRTSQRAIEIRSQEKEHQRHELEKEKLRHEQKIALMQLAKDAERSQQQLDATLQQQIRQESDQKWIATLESLKELGVELSAYLTQARADQVIELRSPSDQIQPHLHLNRTSQD